MKWRAGSEGTPGCSASPAHTGSTPGPPTRQHPESLPDVPSHPGQGRAPPPTAALPWEPRSQSHTGTTRPRSPKCRPLHSCVGWGREEGWSPGEAGRGKVTHPQAYPLPCRSKQEPGYTCLATGTDPPQLGGPGRPAPGRAARARHHLWRLLTSTCSLPSSFPLGPTCS